MGENVRRMGAIAGLAAVIATAAMVVLPSSAGATQATPCTGFLPPGTYGGVVVPVGATCILGGPATVHGGIRVEPGASLIIGPATVDGGISANNPASIVVHGVTINGGIAVHGGFGTAPEGCNSEDCVFFTAIEDSNINGGATVDGYTGFGLDSSATM